ncbi:ATP-grasp domain-containing protein [Pseudomonas fuscovaginae UPB0736]|uniref:Biotin carboxylase n=1 Tax=Pseudomonas asplenii TaxID=53407 RepID=A0A1H6P2P4_9PSED|nr:MULTISPECIES: ATP-grasp domain-containing protein [Pseudomonas]UUQ65415.1 ATP-grasp domain-containing protein [Pseudomonas fuscovaginae UPB0736]UZE31379.1 ATP-grasp domain-containing protein [Pseudomonas asplenii]SEI18311.1 Biotin carboxylase [Pseudomonas fuscovaginae]
MDRVVVVDGFSSGKHLARRLKENACTLMHVASSAELDSYYYTGFDDAIYDRLVVNRDIAATVSAVEDFAPQCVVAGAESGVLLADLLNERLNLPYCNRFDRTRARRNKYEMIRCVARAGLSVAQQCIAGSWGEAGDWIERHGKFPVVLKPLESAGADGVTICNDLPACERAFGKLLGKRNKLNSENVQVLIQEYLAGVEYVVNMVSLGGRQLVTEVVRYQKQRLDCGSVIYDIDELVGPDDPAYQELVGYTREVVRCLGIENGPSHAEVMLTATGPKLVEIAARTDGILRPGVSEQTTGLGQIEASALSIAKPKEFERLLAARMNYRLLQNTYNVSLINRLQGRFHPDEFMKELRTLASFFEAVFYLEDGQPVAITRDVFSQPGTVYLVHPDIEVIRADYLRIRALEDSAIYLRSG